MAQHYTPPTGKGNAALQAARRKGYVARTAGEPRSANPYADESNSSGRPSWRGQFWRFWRHGWELADQRKPLP